VTDLADGAHGRGVTTELVLTARGPADLLGAMPYLLGFHPTDSLAVAVIEDSRIACVARIDMADARVPGRPALLLGPFLDQVGAGGRLALVGYGDDSGAVAAVVRRVAVELPLPAFTELVVSGGQWWHVDSPEEAEPYDPGASRIAAEAAYHGLTARPTRRDLEGLFHRPSRLKRLPDLTLNAAARRVVRMTPDAARRRLNSLLKAQLEGAPMTLSTRECAELLMLLDVPAARDAFWLLLGRETASALVDLWLYVSWRAPMELSLGAVCAAGLAGWQSGTGALVTVALERADRIGGWHPLWDLLTRIHGLALPPSALDEIQSALAIEG
jgi:hypothetical protein